MQKFVRQGMEREAMEMAVELIHTSKAFLSMVCNRLVVICNEDLDTQAAPWILPFVVAACAQAKERYAGHEDNPGECRLMIGNAIRMMCRAPKSREGCHFAAAIGLRSLLADWAPEIPDWCNDQHTLIGKRMGRGIDYFREVSAKLVPPQAVKDPWEDEAYHFWGLKERKGKTSSTEATPPE
jgi:replication-associated recombination protein RarA